MMKHSQISSRARIQPVTLDQMRVSPAAQREFRTAWGNHLSENFEIDKVGILVTSYRDGVYWIVDGQHRFHALCEHVRREFGEVLDQWDTPALVHHDLTETEEADLFLALNNRRNVGAYDKFKVGVKAELPEPVAIEAIVRDLGLKVSRGKSAGCITAVGALTSTYRRGGEPLLIRTLETIRDAWDGGGFSTALINGVADVLARYEGRIDAERLSRRLARERRGPLAVTQQAEIIKDSYGVNARTAHAAAVTDVYNKGARGAARLGSWFRKDEDGAAA